ncbi:MAG: transporter substrate-binding protein [Ramlibacter sp.]|nr:transporter substrate-binding protein [Ramlibacter sp.]
MLARVRQLACLLSLFLAAFSSAAQPAWPSRPIRIIVPGGPGTSVDSVARLLSQYLQPRLGVPIVVDYRAGALGAIGGAAVANSAPDGYTFLMGAPDTQVLLALVQPNLTYSPEKDFVPVALVAQSPLVIAASLHSQATSMRELVAFARQHPGRVTFGSGGVGGTQQLTLELLKQREHLQMLHVPYKSGTAAVSGLISGEIDLLAGTAAFLAPLVNSGQVRAIAIARDSRHPLLPGVPTMAESGLANLSMAIWAGVFAPTGTPPEVVGRLSAAIIDAANTPEFRQSLQSAGQDMVPMGHLEFARFLAGEWTRLRDVVRAAGIKAE